MLKPMCSRSKCRKPDVTMRHHSPCATSKLSSPSWRVWSRPWPPRKNTALTAISAIVTYGSVRNDRIVRTAGAPFTQPGHWNPTGAEIMQSGQIGRSHRRHLTPASRSGWR